MISAVSIATMPKAAEITRRPILASIRSEKYAASITPTARCMIVVAASVETTQRWTTHGLIGSGRRARGWPGVIGCLRATGGLAGPEHMYPGYRSDPPSTYGRDVALFW